MLKNEDDISSIAANDKLSRGCALSDDHGAA